MAGLTRVKDLNSYFWFGFLPLHIFFFVSLILWQMTWANLGTVLVLWTLISGYGIGVGFHRLLSHRSFQTGRLREYLLSYLGCLGVQGSPIFWTAVHRGYHHPYADQDEDFHTPRKGFAWSYAGWCLLTPYEKFNMKYAGRLLGDRLQFEWLHKRYFVVIWLSWFFAYLISPPLFFNLVVAQIIALHLEFCVNYFCHHPRFGYRNFHDQNDSRNIFVFGLIAWGVGFHNNHHHFPKRYDFGYKPGEIDPAKFLVRTVRTVR